MEVLINGMTAPAAIRNLYIAGLPEDFTDEELHSIFSSCGEIEAAKCMFERDTGKCKGYGFVLYQNAEIAAQATRRFHKSVIRGKQLTVRLSHPTATPRREGSSSLPGSANSSANSLETMSMMSSAHSAPSLQSMMSAPSLMTTLPPGTVYSANSMIMSAPPPGTVLYQAPQQMQQVMYVTAGPPQQMAPGTTIMMNAPAATGGTQQPGHYYIAQAPVQSGNAPPAVLQAGAFTQYLQPGQVPAGAFAFQQQPPVGTYFKL